jgi:hypothetical protein
LPFTATAAFDAFAAVAARVVRGSGVAATPDAVDEPSVEAETDDGEADAARRLSRRAVRADPEDEDVTLSSS